MYEQEMKRQLKREDDYNMLVDWGLKSKLTPAQLAFAFKKMGEALKRELHAFKEIEETYERIFLVKAVKCMEVQNDLRLKKELEEKASAEKLRYELETCRQEFQTLCGQVPFNFLGTMRSACKSDRDEEGQGQRSSSGGVARDLSRDLNGSVADTKDVGRQPLLTAKKTSGGPATSSQRKTNTIADQQQGTFIDNNHLRDKLKVLLASGRGHTSAASGGAVAVVRQKSRGGAARVSEDGVLAFIVTEIEAYFHYLNQNPSGRGHKKAKEPASGGGGERDGRLTYEEFVKVMFTAGISWLNDEEMRSKFEAMDIDNSGKLNLSEVFSAATRMQHLVEGARDYERSQVEKGRRLTQVQVMQEYAGTILKGDNLCTTVSNGNVIPKPGVKTSASSGNPEFTHLERKDHTWVPDFQDEELWIQWDLGAPCTVTAVSTCGHPVLQSWVTQYGIEFWEERRKHQLPDGREEMVTYFELFHENEDALHSAEEQEQLQRYWQSLPPAQEGSSGQWVAYPNPGSPPEPQFANHDHSSIGENDLDPPIETTCIRLRVHEFVEKPTMRGAVYGYAIDADAQAREGTGAVPVPSRPVIRKVTSRSGSKSAPRGY